MTKPRLLERARLACALVPLLASAAGAVGHRHVESFDTKAYCDTVRTTALWDTAAGELRLPPFQITVAGTYNTAGNARGIAVDGHHAFVADYSAGLQILDITNAAAPVLVGTYNTPGNAKDVAIAGDRAYVADYASGVQVINITNLAAPTLAGTYDTPGSARDVAVAGDYLYVADYTSGLLVLNITNPASPTLVGSYDTPGTALGVAVAGNDAFVADGATGLLVINVTSPASPTLRGTCDTPGSATAVALSGDRAYVADAGAGLQVINITNPASPTLLGGYDTPGTAGDVQVDGNRAYVADGITGLLEIDITNPAAPSLVTGADTPGTAYGVALAGDLAYVADDVWGLQDMRIATYATPTRVGGYDTASASWGVAVSGDRLYVADGNDGLLILNITDPAHPVLVGQYVGLDFAYAVAVDGDYAFLACDLGGLLVLDVSDPSAPHLVGQASLAAHDVVIAGDYAYVACGVFGLYVLNISNPASPTVAGSLATGDNVWRLAVSGDYAFLARWSSGGFFVVDLSNPAAPFLAATYDTPDSGRDIAVAGNYAYVADWSGHLRIVNISNPSAPALAGAYSGALASGVAVVGGHAYVSDYNGSLKVLDVSDPANPTLTGTCAMPSVLYDVAVAGDYAYVGNAGAGVQVVGCRQGRDDITRNAGRSLALDVPSDDVLSARLSTAQSGEISWELSADGGTSWQSVLPGAAWSRFVTPGQALQWRSTHVYGAYGINPTCTYLQVDWLHAGAVIDSVRDIPGDQGGRVRVAFARSAYDFADEVVHPVTGYDIWRRVDDAALRSALAAGRASRRGAKAAPAGALPILELEGRSFVISGAALQAAGFPQGTWEVLGSFLATQQDQYVYAASTTADSTATIPYAVYCITAHTTTPSIWYASAPDSGYSVDNLAPSVPTGLQLAASVLTWDVCPETDFDYFTVYGSATDGLASATRLGYTVSPSRDVGSAPYAWYLVTASDFAGNEGEPASVRNGATPAPALELRPTSYALYAPRPNPFRGQTSIQFDLPVQGPVRLQIFDVTGRRVATLAEETLPVGRHARVWNGRDADGRRTSPGVYFVRFTSAAEVRTQQIVQLR
ncbi:MAG: T9SS type A sorting domain-containing protein [bacterium]